jgi:hypothetical protein
VFQSSHSLRIPLKKWAEHPERLDGWKVERVEVRKKVWAYQLTRESKPEDEHKLIELKVKIEESK